MKKTEHSNKQYTLINKRIKNILIIEILSDENKHLTKEQKNDIYKKYMQKLTPKEYLSCIEDESVRNKYIELFNLLDNDISEGIRFSEKSH